ncbi:MAG: hypothetical protein JW812_00145 [Alphaproteobacteria bacterium]|nr:hypothetical protein [Alphaproteobacteria bacterium]MBN2779732.1 hypothetical protein [Alphaproteobacteria bacterium]
MKKISLLSLVAVAGVAFAAPSYANTENPLYLPKAGNLFIKGDMNYNNYEEKMTNAPAATDTVRNDDFNSGEWSDSFTLGYGFTNNFAMTVSNEAPMWMQTNAPLAVDPTSEDRTPAPVVTGIFRAIKNGNVMLDIVAAVNPALQYNEAFTVGGGIRAGVMTNKMTLAFGGYVGYGMSYDHTDLSTGNDNGEVDDNMAYTITGDFQFNFSKDMSLNIGGKYFIIDEQETTGGNFGEIEGYRVEVGLNFETKKRLLVTPYLAYADIEQDDIAVSTDGYEAAGMEYGVRFGLEF